MHVAFHASFIRLPPQQQQVAFPHLYVSIRQHTSECASIRQHTSACISMHQHTSAYVSIRQHTSAYLSIPQHTSANLSIPQHTSAYSYIHTYIHTYLCLSLSLSLSLFVCVCVCVCVCGIFHTLRGASFTQFYSLSFSFTSFQITHRHAYTAASNAFTQLYSALLPASHSALLAAYYSFTQRYHLLPDTHIPAYS
jgi:hypothetical protein